MTGFYFNSTSSSPPVLGATANGSFQPIVGIQNGDDSFKADGDGYFDYLIDFNSSGNIFTVGEKTVITLTGTGIDESSFDMGSADGTGVGSGFGYKVLARVQGLDVDNEGSGWFSAPPPQTAPPPGIPEPTSLAIWCLGMVAAGFGARRMRKQK
jgi:hypothetical protein